MEYYKWESNKQGGGVFMTMSDSWPLYVAEAFGATLEVRVNRAAVIAEAVNAHASLTAKAELFDALYIHCENLLLSLVIPYEVTLQSHSIKQIGDLLSKAKELK